MGLPISLFAVMMLGVIGSLLFIIFSFSFIGTFIVFGFNAVAYIALTHITNDPGLVHFQKVFPKSISNKKGSRLCYE